LAASPASPEVTCWAAFWLPRLVQGFCLQVQSHLMDAAGALKDKVQQAAAAVGDAIDDLGGKGS
jgi:hypothetical protein